MAEKSVIVGVDDCQPRVSIRPAFVGPDDPLDGPGLSESVLHEGEAENGWVSARVDDRRCVLDPERAQSYPLCLQSGLRWIPLHASSVTQPGNREGAHEHMRPNLSSALAVPDATPAEEPIRSTANCAVIASSPVRRQIRLRSSSQVVCFCIARAEANARLAPPTALLRTALKARHRGRQSRIVVNRVVPRTTSTSFCSVSVNPTLASTRREAVFQSQTVAHRRSYPDDLAQSRTASAASVAYP